MRIIKYVYLLTILQFTVTRSKCDLDAADRAKSLPGPDISYAGCEINFEQATLPIIAELKPSAGDCFDAFKEALAEASKVTPKLFGLRGIIRMAPGVYHISKPIRINVDGVVIGGVPGGPAPVILPTGSFQDAAVVVEPKIAESQPNQPSTLDGDYVGNVLNRAIQINQSDVAVENVENRLVVGDKIKLVRSSSREWIDLVRMGDRPDGKHWKPGKVDTIYFRTVKAISGNALSLDAPVYDDLNSDISRVYLKKDRTEYVKNVAIENLVIVCREKGNMVGDEYCRSGVRLSFAENCAVRNVKVSNYSTVGLEVTKYSRKVTLYQCAAENPITTDLENRGYGFRIKESQLILFHYCTSRSNRCSFVFFGGPTVSGIFLRNCRCEETIGASIVVVGAWSHGFVFEDVYDMSPSTAYAVNLSNTRGFDSPPGWSIVNSIIWNCHFLKDKVRLSKPPIGYNRQYIVGIPTNCGDDSNDCIDWIPPEKIFSLAEEWAKRHLK